MTDTNYHQHPFVEIHNLKVSYPSSKRLSLKKSRFIPALTDLNLYVNQGEFVSILGANGSGKTSLLRAIAGFERPSSGTIRVGHKTMVSKDINMPAHQRPVGMVFQGLALFPHMSVAQNIIFGLHHLDPFKQRHRLDEICEMCAIDDLKDRYVYELSGGQRQKVALCRALAPEPLVLLLDEPFSHLDPRHRLQLGMEIQSLLHQLNVTTLMVTHDKIQALELSDQVGVMIEGKMAQFAPPKQVFDYPQTESVARFLGETNFVPCTPTDTGYLTPFGSIPFHRIATALSSHPSSQNKPSSKMMVMGCKSDDFMLISAKESYRDRESSTESCTPQPFEVVSESFSGFYKTLCVKLPSEHIITFRLPSDHNSSLKGAKICLKKKQFCVYERPDVNFNHTKS